MSDRWIFTTVGAIALLAGAGMWLATQPRSAALPAVEVAPAALYAASFRGIGGEARSLGEYQGKVVVLNFWATWCAPCREEMPSFSRLQARWGSHGVQFVGISSEDAAKVAAFGKSLGVDYPLWIGGEEAAELSRRLGNSAGVLPHTVVLDRSGNVYKTQVGAYPEPDLDKILSLISLK